MDLRRENQVRYQFFSILHNYREVLSPHPPTFLNLPFILYCMKLCSSLTFYSWSLLETGISFFPLHWREETHLIQYLVLQLKWLLSSDCISTALSSVWEDIGIKYHSLGFLFVCFVLLSQSLPEQAVKMQPESWGSSLDGKKCFSVLVWIFSISLFGGFFICFVFLVFFFSLPFQKTLVRLLLQNVLGACVWVWAVSKALAQFFGFGILDSNVL